MAYDVDKRPATWVWEQAKKRRSRWLAVAIVLFVTSPLALVLNLTGHRALAIVALAFTLILSYLVWKPLAPKVDAAVHWIEGARAEEAIGDLLNELRNEGFVVMHDIEQVGEGNVDHLVSGPTGVFMIESKTRHYENGDLAKATWRAKNLRKQLGVWVTAVICIHERTGNLFRQKNVWIVPEPALLDWIREQKNRPVPFERLARFADTLQS
jgi:hypothetical protein